MNKEGQILFYSRDEPYGWLSNFHRATELVDDVEGLLKVPYPTNEHYYQSQKVYCDWCSDAKPEWPPDVEYKRLHPEEREIGLWLCDSCWEDPENQDEIEELNLQ